MQGQAADCIFIIMRKKVKMAYRCAANMLHMRQKRMAHTDLGTKGVREEVGYRDAPHLNRERIKILMCLSAGKARDLGNMIINL